jgi:hypothetical protein
LSPQASPGEGFHLLHDKLIFFPSSGYSCNATNLLPLTIADHELGGDAEIFALIQKVFSNLEKIFVNFEVSSSTQSRQVPSTEFNHEPMRESDELILSYCNMPLRHALDGKFDYLHSTVESHTANGLYILLKYFVGSLSCLEKIHQTSVKSLFPEYCKTSNSNLLLIEFFVCLYQLHDIGKAYNRELQDEVSCAILESLSSRQQLCVSDSGFKLLSSLIRGDINLYKDLLQYCYYEVPEPLYKQKKDLSLQKHHGKVPLSVLRDYGASLTVKPSAEYEDYIDLISDAITKGSRSLGLPTEMYYKILLVYYQVDTLAYTSLAKTVEGVHEAPNFDCLYQINPEYRVNRSKPPFIFCEKSGRFKFSPSIEEIFMKIQEKLDLA